MVEWLEGRMVVLMVELWVVERLNGWMVGELDG
jgi:hypothetical protein